MRFTKRSKRPDLTTIQAQLAKTEGELAVSRASNNILETLVKQKNVEDRIAGDIDAMLQTQDLTPPQDRIRELVSTEKKMALIMRVMSGSLREPVEVVLKRIGMAMGLNDCNLQSVIDRADALQSLAPLRDQMKMFMLDVEDEDVRFSRCEDAEEFRRLREVLTR